VVNLSKATAIQEPELQYQIILPGSYVALKDSAYAAAGTA
jgi:hypothetical protein